MENVNEIVNELVFGELVFDKNVGIQEVSANGVCYGVYVQDVPANIFKKPNFYYQVLMTEENGKYADKTYISEDEGYVFGIFYDVRDFIKNIIIDKKGVVFVKS